MEGYAVLKERKMRPPIKGIKGYTQYKSQKYRFSFEYPKNWRLSDRKSVV